MILGDLQQSVCLSGSAVNVKGRWNWLYSTLSSAASLLGDLKLLNLSVPQVPHLLNCCPP